MNSPISLFSQVMLMYRQFSITSQEELPRPGKFIPIVMEYETVAFMPLRSKSWSHNHDLTYADNNKSANFGDTVTSLGQAISEVVKESGWEEPLERHRALIVWEQVVGPYLASHCHAVEIRGETLYVSVANPAWRSEVSFLKNDILQGINQNLKTHLIKDIRFQ